MKKKVYGIPGAGTGGQDEPIGIVISSGDRGEVRSVFSAYIWGPAPETAPAPAPASKVA
ncbi:MAG: hypothetical protein H0U13_01925 [Gemmatimonadaceae bacterium]|nr:hypothetical protein [Gemmatimonadaceae bacterium]